MEAHALRLGEVCGGLIEEWLDGPRSTAGRLRTLFEIERVRLDPPGLSLVGAPAGDALLCEVDVLLVNPARRLAAATSPLMPESFYQRRIRLLLELGAGFGRATLLEIDPPARAAGSVDEHLRAFLSARVGRVAAWREFAVRARMIGIHPSLHGSAFRLLLEEVARAAQGHAARRGRGEEV